MFVVCVFEDEDLVTGKWCDSSDYGRWKVKSILDILVIEQLTSDAGVPGSITGSAICFHLYFFVIYVFIPPTPTTFGAIAFFDQAFVFNKSWQGELLSCVSLRANT